MSLSKNIREALTLSQILITTEDLELGDEAEVIYDLLRTALQKLPDSFTTHDKTTKKAIEAVMQEMEDDMDDMEDDMENELDDIW